jgi:hypothetical protein
MADNIQGKATSDDFTDDSFIFHRGDGGLNPTRDGGDTTKSKVFAVMDILNSKLSQPEDTYAIKNQCKLLQ